MQKWRRGASRTTPDPSCCNLVEFKGRGHGSKVRVVVAEVELVQSIVKRVERTVGDRRHAVVGDIETRHAQHTETERTHTHTHIHIRLTALCPGLPGSAGTRKVKPIWTLLEQETVKYTVYGYS